MIGPMDVMWWWLIPLLPIVVAFGSPDPPKPPPPPPPPTDENAAAQEAQAQERAKQQGKQGRGSTIKTKRTVLTNQEFQESLAPSQDVLAGQQRTGVGGLAGVTGQRVNQTGVPPGAYM
jgi:type IV secretory pathway VirB10-like protein